MFLLKKLNNMNMTILRNAKVLVLGLLASFSLATLNGCQDEVDKSNRFTFTGELISDYLQNNPEFSDFCFILDKAKIGKKSSSSILKTLSTYGSYTCFAPTNDAVRAHIDKLYAEYIESIELNKENPDNPIIFNGITSPNLEEISDSMATEIAKNHIIEMGYKTIDINEGAFPMVTMNRRFTTLEFPVNADGSVTPVLNNEARIIRIDLEMENGYVQVIDAVLAPSVKMSNELLADQPSFTTFSSAVKMTGLDKFLSEYEIDPNYDNTVLGPPFQTQNNMTPPVPEENHQRFTLLVESDDLLADPTKNSLGMSIKNLDDLVKFAEHWYGTEAQGEYDNPKNALYKFIAYHIIDRRLLYSSSTGPGGFLMEAYDWKDFSSEVNMPKSFDRYDYFETKLPYTMVKVTKPFTNTSSYKRYGSDSETPFSQEIVINYAQDGGTRCVVPGMEHHINVVVEPASVSKKRPGLEEFNQNPLNGIIHTIDKILIYNEEEMVSNILNERMRWDIMSIFPELTNNGVRWALQDQYTLTYIPPGFSSRLEQLNNDTHVYYLRPHSTSLGGYVNFQGDELLVIGKYDFKYRLPHVPTGNYEIRFGFSMSDARGIVQMYLDGKICGIPVNLKNTTENLLFIGWTGDDELGSEEEIKEYDKAMRNRGFMKAPASIHVTKEGNSMRESNLALRKVLGTYRLASGESHWLRFKEVTENSTGKLCEFNQDYIEIVPTSIITDQRKPEDIN